MELTYGLNRLHYRDGQLYYLYVPHAVITDPEDAKILVSVHGYSGRKDNERGRKRVQRAAERWSYLADTHRWVVLSPHFDEKRFGNNYQRLNFSGIRSDIRLNQLIEEIRRIIPCVCTDTILLFGFSGGGQFVHRYAAFHPHRVDRAVAGAAGWYLWPDDTLPYPIGTLLSGSIKHPEPRIIELCRLKLLVIVGENDFEQGEFRKKCKGYNISAIQGEGRLLRARNWIESLRKFSNNRGSRCRVRLNIVPSTGHTISRKLKRRSGQYLSGQYPNNPPNQANRK